ncbi:MAG: glutamate racemase [Candidatus Eiseniibacteriota bacterium]
MTAAGDPRPIGVFDSGLGGLTAVRELFRTLPNESIVYFGDTARLPYGTKSRDTVTRFSLEIASFLVRQDIKCLLVACATASSYALETLEQRLKVPVVGVIRPAAEAAVRASAHGRIGVLGTPATVTSRAYPEAIAHLAPQAVVTSRACPLFVPLIEEGWIEHPVLREVANEYLVELRAANPESVILGCTHYPLVAPVLQQQLGADVRLVDAGAEAARALAAMLAERAMLAAGPAHHRFFLSDERIQFQRIAESFLGRPMPAITIVDQTDLPWFERTHEASA